MNDFIVLHVALSLHCLVVACCYQQTKKSDLPAFWLAAALYVGLNAVVLSVRYVMTVGSL